MTAPDDLLIAHAEHQHGLISRCQVRSVGLTDRAWRHRLDRGHWVRITDRVARRPGSPTTLHQRTLAAVLDVGPSAYVSHRSAAAIWGLPGFDVEPIEVIVERAGRQTRTELATTHRPRHLPDPFAAVVDGVPVVRPALVLLQLAPRISAPRLRWMLDRLWAKRLLSGPSVRRELAGLMHRGRAGTVAVRDLLDSLPEGYVPPASGLEGRFADILEQGGLPSMRRQVDLGDDERWCARVDFLAGDLPLVVEVDSDRYHAALTDQEADAARQARLEAAGYRVLRFTETDVWRRPAEVLAALRRARVELDVVRRRAA